MTLLSGWYPCFVRLSLRKWYDIVNVYNTVLFHRGNSGIFVWCGIKDLYSLSDSTTHHQGLYSLRRRRLIGIGIPIINLRRSSDRLRFIMGIPIPVRRPILLTWINFNPSTDKKPHGKYSVDDIIYPFPNLSGATVEFWQRVRRLIPLFMVDVTI